MLDSWVVVLSALAYLCALFAIAHIGDTSSREMFDGRWRAAVYPLTIAVYCTSWTFYGSVGLASRSGLDFLTIYIGPVLVIGIGWRFVMRIVALAKAQNITSIADFVASRYGKSEKVAAVVTLIAVLGAIPYIALQLKAVSISLTTFLGALDTGSLATAGDGGGSVALIVAAGLTAFAIAFGTRHIDATEHQNGLVLAIAIESVIKLIAFLIVGFFVAYIMFDGVADIVHRAEAATRSAFLERTSGPASFLTFILLSSCAALLLPRQFHMIVVENRRTQDVRRMAWTFTAYLCLINLFVIPLALAGELVFPGSTDRDMTVLALPLHANAGTVALIAFIGGLSAATAMVIVDSVALAIMISNDLVMPLVLRRRAAVGAFGTDEPGSANIGGSADMGRFVLVVRRLAILGVILLAYGYYRVAEEAALASIGLLSFAAVAQIAPAFIGGLVWRRGTSLGTVAGLTAGIAMWAYTLLLPSLAAPGSDTGSFLSGPFGLTIINPMLLLGIQPGELTGGVMWSLGINIACYIGFSLMRPATAMERLQANVFVSPEPRMGQSLTHGRATASYDELRTTIARYLGQERTDHAFDSFDASRETSSRGPHAADIHAIRFAEHLLASAIGAASSRLVMSMLVNRGSFSSRKAMKLLDDASAAIQYNRDVLQHALDNAEQGITVLDQDLRLVAWNRAFENLYSLPRDLVRVGVGLDDIVSFNARRGSYGPGHVDDLVASRLASIVRDGEPMRVKLLPSGKVIEVRSNHLPDGGYVTTYTEITQTVAAEEAQARANETLERRVDERTQELTRLNEALTRAKAEAEEANLSKTRFLAAASHDILQPLNAARLYATALVERDRTGRDSALAENIDASLDAVEEILTALLDMSRLDAGQMKAELSIFAIDDVLRQLQREFEPMAHEKGLRLAFVPSSLAVRSDRRLLRRLLQNLISNAIKYTPSGKVLIGCRRQRGHLRVEVWDTGLGIPTSKQKAVFREFHRLDQGAKQARGLGLGLSIVERIGRVLNHAVTLKSEPGRGSTFAVVLPTAVPLPGRRKAAAGEPSPAAPLAGLKVLAIDNDPAIVDGMRTLLAGWGCKVMTAGGVEEAQRVIRDTYDHPDVVIADYHLDDGDGLDAIVALRWKMNHHFNAVLLTADRSPDVRDSALEKNVHVLNKPLKPAALRALLAQWRAARIAAE
ncbi:PAS domain-containing hybrid sensor histidine kinase/response regulator [Chelatococcus reniformis]|uniref:histidine kinase n=1 Tax=Chelatococcus reniformis TaxID=1494448 RepID=A0A916UQL4_9HYPH|nr:PAS domain-containing hybrid sensor histidine kinase/response regulator [Chelatococcus reniformis]GGC83534.1 histidine kinase [Chelatococcus reniformis]